MTVRGLVVVVFVLIFIVVIVISGLGEDANLSAGPDGDDEVVTKGLPAHHEPLVDLADEVFYRLVVEVGCDAERGVGGGLGVVQVDAADLITLTLDNKALGLLGTGLTFEAVGCHLSL